MRAKSPDTPQLDEAPAAPPRSRFKPLAAAITRVHRAGIVLVLVIFWAILTVVSPYFLTVRNITDLFLQSATIGITAAGVTVVLLTSEIDLSVGSMEALSGSVAAYVAIKIGAPWPVGVLAALCTGAAVGLINGALVTLLKLQSFIVTLGMLGIAQGLALVLTGGQAISGFSSAYQALGQNKVAGVPVPVLIAIGVYVTLWAVLRYTRFGFNVYAVGGNAEAARLAGVRPQIVKLLTFGISGTCAALAGVLLSARLDAGSGTFGADDLLNAIAGVVIGGTSLFGGVGSVVGTGVGILLIGTITNGLDLLNVSTFWQQVAIGALIIGAVSVERVTKGAR
jgi:ribose/xylose/arabinose/galactoside ABC-type transport system permease subunit